MLGKRLLDPDEGRVVELGQVDADRLGAESLAPSLFAWQFTLAPAARLITHTSSAAGAAP